MSYARFSTNAFCSDVYAIKHARGYYKIWVAANRYEVDRSGLPPKPDEDEEDFARKLAERQKATMELIKGETPAPIGGPFDGDSYREETAEEALLRLQKIRSAGYNVPQGATSRLRAECEECAPDEPSSHKTSS
jgi:hypothetical protein